MIDYFRSGDYIEIIIRDFSGKKIEEHKCNLSDTKKISNLMAYLKSKYGFSPEISPSDYDNDFRDKDNIFW